MGILDQTVPEVKTGSILECYLLTKTPIYMIEYTIIGCILYFWMDVTSCFTTILIMKPAIHGA